MVESIRKALTIPYLPLEAVATVATVASFGWLLVNDLIQPIVVYLLQLYLSF